MPSGRRLFATAAVGLCAGCIVISRSASQIGPTGDFEVNYPQFILDHHYSGLRATELAADTALVGPTMSDPYPSDPARFCRYPQKTPTTSCLDCGDE